MERFTKQENGQWTVDENKLSQAIEQLAKWEDLLFGLEQEQTALAEMLERLRSQGKTKTVQFKEGVAQKLVLGQVKLLLARYGLLEKGV